VQNGNTVSFGQSTFYLGKHELKQGDKYKRLSHKETQLIKILHENRNQAIDRRVILKAIWDDDYFFNSRNLDVYITKLRGYFKTDPNVQIVTLKGVGYHFMVEESVYNLLLVIRAGLKALRAYGD
jgi:DNA-binding response OmpR family regulator